MATADLAQTNGAFRDGSDIPQALTMVGKPLRLLSSFGDRRIIRGAN
jgi:hypothetical protein